MFDDHRIQKVEIWQKDSFKFKTPTSTSFYTGYQCQNMSYNYPLYWRQQGIILGVESGIIYTPELKSN